MIASYPKQVTHRFELLRHLGAGGMAVVYEAVDRVTSARVALKVLNSIDGVSRVRFKREFRATQDLQHPNLVRLHELFEDGEALFFTMDLVDGVDFLSFVQGSAGQPVTEDTLPLARRESQARAGRGDGGVNTTRLACDEVRLRDALAQLVRAVTALHKHGLVHRDIKPSNILITQGGELRLLDFGLISDPAVQLSITKQLVGTARYMAPEQASDDAVGPQADWYSVGVLLFEALTGTLPFVGSSIDVLAHKRRYDAPPPRALVFGVPPDLDRLCEGLLSRDPASRPSGSQIAIALGLGEPPVNRPRADPATQLVAKSMFVGRLDERRWLRAQYQRVHRDGLVAISIRGESGIGKSTLVRQFLDELRADEPSLVVLRGRCYENESVAYKGIDGIVESLAAFLRRLPVEAAAALAPRHTAALTLQFPALATIPGLITSMTATSSGDPQTARTQAMRALRELLVRLADRYPLVIWLDDLQWIDADGGFVLNELIQPPEAPPALLLVAHTMTAGGGKAIESSSCTKEVLSLGPLGQDDARAFVAACALRDGIALDEREAHRLAHEAQGHPIFLHELVHHATARGAPGGSGTFLLDDVLWARITGLPPASRALLELASVAGSPVPLVVAAAGAQLEVAQTVAWVAQLRADRLLSTSGTSAEVTLQPSHDRVRRTVLARLDSTRVVAWHHSLATAFEDAAIGDAELLAMHWSQAGELARAAPHAAHAGFAAARAFAFDRAAALFRIAVSGTSDAGERRQQLAKQAEALANAGRGPEAARIFLECAASSSSPEEALALRHRAADQFLCSGHIDEGLEALHDLLGAAGMRFPRTPRAALASLIYHRARLALRGLGYVERPEADVPPAALRRLDVCYSIAAGLGYVDLVRGADFQSRCLLLALDAGEPYRLARALAAEAIFAASESRRSRQRARQLLATAGELVRKTRHPNAAGGVALAQGIAAMHEGQFEDSLRFSKQAESIFVGQCPGATWELATARAFTIWSLMLLGRLNELAVKVPDLVRDCRERGDRLGFMSLTSGPIHVLGLARDQAAEMRADCKAGLANWAQSGFHFQHLCGLFTLAAADLYEGFADAAVESVESTWKDVERSLLLRVQFFRLDLWALRGRVALAAAGHDASSVHVRRVEQAIARIEREQMAWANGHALALRAGVARLRGDAPLACTLLERAERCFAGSTMSVHAAACKLQRGMLLGAAGTEVFTHGCSLLADEGVRRPSRFAATLVPIAACS